MKTRKIPRARYGPLVWRDGRCLDANDARDFAQAVHEYFVRTHVSPSRIMLQLFPVEEFTLLAELPPQLEERAALRERLLAAPVAARPATIGKIATEIYSNANTARAAGNSNTRRQHEGAGRYV